jgi:division protein CdvB (Snf7/Vps24/ESCRT-III family)
MSDILLFEEILRLREDVKKRIDKIMSQISVFQAKVQVQFDSLTGSLSSFSTDIAILAKQISDLQAQIAASSSTLAPADQALLDTTVTNATALATAASTMVANIPDLPPPTPPGV